MENVKAQHHSNNLRGQKTKTGEVEGEVLYRSGAKGLNSSIDPPDLV